MEFGGGAGTTLPLRMFNYLRTEINPTIAVTGFTFDDSRIP